MTHKEKILNSLKKYGKLIEVVTLDDIPKTDYIYTVINGNNVLQIGKSSPGNKGRLKLVFKGSILGKHNKAFICGLYPSVVDLNNKYYAIALTNHQDKTKVENNIHHDMGISTNIKAAKVSGKNVFLEIFSISHIHIIQYNNCDYFLNAPPSPKGGDQSSALKAHC